MTYAPLSEVIDESIAIDASVVEQLRTFRHAAKLTNLPGVDVTEERERLAKVLNDLVDRLLNGIEKHPTKLWVLKQFQPSLESVEGEDTEGREHFGVEIKSIMEILGIESSEGLLSYYLGGISGCGCLQSAKTGRSSVWVHTLINVNMNTNALVAVLNRLEEIRVGTTDIGELSGVTNAIVRIKSAGAIDLESTLKQIRDELFYYKGPLYDSFDASENMKALRQELYLAFKRAINILIENRRPDLKLAIGDR